MQIYETSFSYIFLSCANFVKRIAFQHTPYTLFRYICDTLNLIHSLYTVSYTHLTLPTT